MKELYRYRESYRELVDVFVKRWYFELYGEEYDETDYEIMHEDSNFGPGHICIVGEYYFSIDEIYQCLLLKMPMKIMENWYYHCYDLMMEDKKPEVILLNYYKQSIYSKDELQKELDEDLKKSEDKVKESYNLLREEILKHK